MLDDITWITGLPLSWKTLASQAAAQRNDQEPHTAIDQDVAQHAHDIYRSVSSVLRVAALTKRSSGRRISVRRRPRTVPSSQRPKGAITTRAIRRQRIAHCPLSGCQFHQGPAQHRIDRQAKHDEPKRRR